MTIHDENGELKTVSLMLREGDKVVNTANNYEMKFFTWQKGVGFSEDFSRKGIVNGEMGRVAKIMKVKDGKTVRQRVYVQVSSGQFVMYEDNWDDLTLAYAMTIHRRRAASGPSSLRLSCPATARCSTGRSCTHSTPVRRTRPCCMEHRALSNMLSTILIRPSGTPGFRSGSAGLERKIDPTSDGYTPGGGVLLLPFWTGSPSLF